MTGVPPYTVERSAGPRGEGGFDVGDEEHFVHDVAHGSAILGEHLAHVVVGLPHLRAHVTRRDDVAFVVVAHLSGDVDGVSHFHALGIAIIAFPGHAETFRFLGDRHVRLLPLT